MTLRLRLTVIALLVVLAALGLHLVGARTAAAAATKPAKRAKREHHAPAQEPTRLAAPIHRRAVRQAARPTPRPGGMVLFVRRRGATARIAADPSASIVDFSFAPATITIHVGDTITWTNVGHQPHSATANNHSFDTGILRHGQSGSHTFTAAGTYTYFCIVHPYMTGTVVVLANTTTTTTTTTPSTTTTTPTTPSTASSSGLPNTGLDIAGVVLCGAALTGLGLVLRRRLT